MCPNNLVNLYNTEGDELLGDIVLYKNQTEIGELVLNEIYFILKRKYKKHCKLVLAKRPGPNFPKDYR